MTVTHDTDIHDTDMARHAGAPRHDWTRAEIHTLFALPLPELIFQAQQVHRLHFDPTEVQVSTLLSIRLAAARKTAPIVRRVRITTLASMPQS
jgi:hypothetical protein